MKVWIEYPTETRFARQPRDVLYTPIFFANEGITAHLRLDNEWRTLYGEELDRQFNARIKLVGKTALGFLSIGGKPVNGMDMRYAIPNLGFKPIYTLEILNVFKRVSLSNLEYDAEDGVRGGRVPFSFRLPTATLDDLQQLASSLKIITADNVSTMGFLKGITPALIVSVQYMLVAEIIDVNDNNKVKCTQSDDIRLFVSLSQEQVPTSTERAITSNPMANFVTTQVVPITSTRSRRGSIPLIRRLSRTSSSAQDANFMTIDVQSVEPFTFTRQSDAAASKVTISLLYNNNSPDTPPPVSANITWMLKSLTTLTLEPIEADENSEQTDDFFHLRAKLLPTRKLKLNWSEWRRTSDTSGGEPGRWKATQTVWLVKDIKGGLTPSFITPYLAHTYYLNLQINLTEDDTKLVRGLSGRGKQKVELDVPVQLRYDLGLVPSYEIDESLPEYDHSLPEYRERQGGEDIAEADEEGGGSGPGRENTNDNNEDNDDENDDGDDVLQALGNLDLNLRTSREGSENGSIPLREEILLPAQRVDTN